jgi:fatty acid desaturase
MNHVEQSNLQDLPVFDSFSSLITAFEKKSISKEVRALSVIKSWPTVLSISFDWTIIAAIGFLNTHYFYWPLYIVSVLFIGCRQHALAIIVHDAAHSRLFKNQKINDLVSNLFCAYPLFIRTETYRENHLKHHQFLNSENDPDWTRKRGLKEWTFPTSRLGFISSLLLETLGKGIFTNLSRFMRFGSSSNQEKATRKSVPLRIIYYIILICCVSVNRMWPTVILFWLVPAFTVLPALLRLRSVAEHFGLSQHNELTSSRNVCASIIERTLFAPHFVGYHLAHHLYPSVPFYNLKKLHQFLMVIESYRSQAHLNSYYLLKTENSVLYDVTKAS